MSHPSASPLASLIAPHGVLRVAINLGNPVLAGLDAAGEPSGISADLSRKLAAQLGLDIEWRVLQKADASVQCVRADEADIGFFAIDPVRGEGRFQVCASCHGKTKGPSWCAAARRCKATARWTRPKTV